jgi:hypothetical protein
MIQIRIPDFIKQVQISKSRRKQYFDNSDPEKYPKKYQNNPRYGFKNGLLHDLVSKEPVVKNASVLDKPRYVAVNGNVILRMHKDVLWRKVMPALDKMFFDALKKGFPKPMVDKIPFPWKISMEFRSHYGYADWDIDNPWIYEKCFHDALKRYLGFDDSILKITNGGEKKFRPVRSYMQQELVITIETDREFCWPKTEKEILVSESSRGKPGDVTYNYIMGMAVIHTGRKKPIFGKAKEAIRKLMFLALNDMVPVRVSDTLWKKYDVFFKEYEKFNVKIIIEP